MKEDTSTETTSVQKQVANVMFLVILTLISGLVLYLIICDTRQRTSDNSRESRQCLRESTQWE